MSAPHGIIRKLFCVVLFYLHWYTT